MNLKLGFIVLISCPSLVAFYAPFGEMEIKIPLDNWIWIAMLCVRGTRLRLGVFRGHYPLILNALNLVALGLYFVPSFYQLQIIRPIPESNCMWNFNFWKQVLSRRLSNK